ncbi:hypothetical protein HNQ94_003031 [Salirhabdus euzebyi]|uniref:Capsule polysaccharide biosynthesis protein n=1 Tax=Salirhabdus euzebyi TaxID=394506 RepID=A0A841Q8D6_9BACI|nr:hypothetical protein [Salirhabdus euzebyi]MBB6454542.1 hypothetical protein [Salirhabdus euzebyi]
MNVGVYLRPWNGTFYTKLSEKTFPKDQIISISEFKGVAQYWVGDSLFNGKDCNNCLFDNKEMMDIYIRCRFLRSLPIDISFNLISKMTESIQTLFEKYKFKIFIGQLIDNYTLDIIERVAQKKNVKFISLVGHFINGYSRFSARGELTNLRRDVSKEEISTVLSKITKEDYKPNFDINKEQSRLLGIKYYYREKVKENYFSLLKHIKSDKYNYHYNTFTFKNKNLNDFINKNTDFEFKKLNDVNIDRDSIYIPLHFTPEATVDYWCEDPLCAFYEDSIIDLICKSSHKLNFIIKEHPAMYMKRELAFYEKLVSFPNVQLVHPYENSNLLLNKVDNIYVYTGSVGVEALIRGKKVFSKTSNYYSDLHPNISITPYLSSTDVQKVVTEYDEKLFIKELLQGLIPAKLINNKKIMNSDLEGISKYLKYYIEECNILSI